MSIPEHNNAMISTNITLGLCVSQSYTVLGTKKPLCVFFLNSIDLQNSTSMHPKFTRHSCETMFTKQDCQSPCSLILYSLILIGNQLLSPVKHNLF